MFRRVLLLVVVGFIGTMAWAEEVRVSFRFEQPALVKRADGFTDLAVAGLVPVAEPGDPMLPSYPAKLLIPRGYAFSSLHVTHAEPVLLGRGIKLNYSRGHFPTLQDPARPAAPNRRIYQSAAPYPADRIVYKGIHELKGYLIVLADLQPFVYRPAAGELYFIPELKVQLNLTPLRDAADSRLLRASWRDRDEVCRLVDNPEAAGTYRFPALRGRDTAYQYLIVTSSTLQTAFQTLATHKAAQGYQTHIELISNIYTNFTGVDNAEKLRNFIRWAYENHGTEYVVLGGDSDVLPYRGCYGKVGDTTDNGIPTDFYFAELSTGNWNADGDSLYGELTDNVDLFAEVALGRISASTAAEATNQINKIIAYENSNPPYTALLLGEELDAQTQGGDSKDVVELEMGGIATSKLYDQNGTWSASTLINSYFNTNNTHIVNHLGHANDTYDMKLYNSNVDSLTNTVPFFVYSQGCYPGNFSANDVCFAEKMTVSTTTAAFAVIMNSRYGWYAAGATNGVSNIFDWEFMETVFEQFDRHLGSALNDSKHKLANYASDGAYRWVYYELTLFGCPETELHWNCTDTTARVVPQSPADDFIVMQDDAVTMTVSAHTNCANPLVNPAVSAEITTARSRATVALADDGVAPDQTAGDGFFSGTWTPTTVGAATIVYSTAGTGLTPSQVQLDGEVVEKMAYHQTSTPMAWLDASAGTAILASQDDAGAVVNIGFTFKFYGKAYDQVLVSSNGLLRFADSYNWDAGNTAIPNPAFPNGVIAALWAALKLNTSARVYYLTTGSAPQRKFVAEWSAIPHYDNVGAATFEIVLEESTNNIYVYYQDTDFGNASYNAGADATAGIEDYNGLKGIQYSYLQSILTDGLAILYTPVDGPVMAVSGHLISGGNGDGILDPGETLNLDITLYNAGNQDGGNVTATCSADNGVTFGVATQNFGDVPVGGSASRTFTFTIPPGIACGQSILFTVNIQSTKPGSGTVDNFGTMTAEVGELLDLVALDDDMEGGIAGWTTELTHGAVDWSQATTASHSPTHSWFTPSQAAVKDDSLISPVFTVPVNAVLSFWHSYYTESGYDGGVLEVRPSGGAWETNVEGLFITGGYTSTLSTSFSNPLPGRRAWSGNSNGFILSELDLSSWAGQDIQIRFRHGCDSSVNYTGWYVDDVTVAGYEYNCGQAATGDVDASGVFDSLDLVILLNVLAGNITAGVSPCNDWAAGDFDASGFLDSPDCPSFCHKLAGSE